MRVNDTIAGLFLIAFAALVIILTLGFPPFPGQKYGPALFPRILATGLIACGAVLIWRSVTDKRASAAWLTIDPWVREPWRLGSFLLTLALLLIYILFSETVGFIPIAFVFLGAMCVWLGVQPLKASIVAAVATLTIHWFFGTLLRVPLPRGWLNSIL